MIGDLYRVIQNNVESLRDYIIRFRREALGISNLDMATTVEALKMGLKNDTPFYDDLVMTPCRNLDEGDKARWPKNNEKSGSGKDRSKWCAYHEDFGNRTDDCIAFRKKIGYLLSKGYMKELFGKNNNKSQDPAKMPEKTASPPPGAKVIAFISRGSDICGTTYSATKKHARETKMNSRERPLSTSTLTTQRTISFEKEDRCDLQDPHHDGLVITLSVDNCFVHKILIDGRSSMNIIQLDALKKWIS
ncbi:uncharacterized protein LOC143607223 [Bidens hawaiensis]|uniref:uncharacterized protein LOC143607223 n=1 Tax=Bidens hawaiensis TaxID=980011 RepID=UPI004048F499